MFQNSETGTRPLTHNMNLEITLAQNELSMGHNLIDMNLEERQFFKQIQFHEHNLREYLHGLQVSSVS